MDFESKKQKILKTLDYWYMLDFASQESEPEERAYPKEYRSRHKSENDGLVDSRGQISSIFDTFKLSTSDNELITIKEAVESRLKKSIGVGMLRTQ